MCYQLLTVIRCHSTIAKTKQKQLVLVIIRSINNKESPKYNMGHPLYLSAHLVQLQGTTQAGKYFRRNISFFSKFPNFLSFLFSDQSASGHFSRGIAALGPRSLNPRSLKQKKKKWSKKGEAMTSSKRCGAKMTSRPGVCSFPQNRITFIAKKKRKKKTSREIFSGFPSLSGFPVYPVLSIDLSLSLSCSRISLYHPPTY